MAQQAQLAQQRLLGPALSPANGSGDNIVSLRGGAIYSIPQVIQWHTCPEAKPLHIRPGPGFHARWPLRPSWLEANRPRAQGILYRRAPFVIFPPRFQQGSHTSILFFLTDPAAATFAWSTVHQTTAHRTPKTSSVGFGDTSSATTKPALSQMTTHILGA